MFCAKSGWNWPGVMERKIFKFHKFISTIVLSTLKKGHGPSFKKKIEFPQLKYALCQVWFKEKMKMWKLTDRQTHESMMDNGQQAIRKARAFNSGGFQYSTSIPIGVQYHQ